MNEAAITTQGERLYVIGDVHGRLDLLTKAFQLISDDADAHHNKTSRIIMLGDYVDRGLHSRQVVDLIMGGQAPLPLIALKGNHEEAFLAALGGGLSLEDWRIFGGRETLASYRIPARDLLGQDEDKIRDLILSRLDPSVIEWMSSRPITHQCGSYFFCHAGVRPGVSLSLQLPEDLLWIREPFLSDQGSFERIIIHGHTIVEHIDVRHNRINIDTGAYATGCLSILILEDDRRFYMNTIDVDKPRQLIDANSR